MGSMLYMSPEQVRGMRVDERSDLYSVGIMLYELTAGRRPFNSDSTFGILEAHLNTPPRPPIELNPSLPQALNDVILTALNKEPAHRFASAEAFRTVLTTIRQRLGSSEAQGVQRPHPQTVFESVRPAAVAAAATDLPQAQTIVETGQPTPGITQTPPQYVHTVVELQSAAPPRSVTFDAPPSSAGAPVAPHAMPSGSGAPGSGGKKPNRGLWMAAGAVACVCVLAGAAVTLPNFFKGSANTTSSKASGKIDTMPIQPPTPHPKVEPNSDKVSLAVAPAAGLVQLKRKRVRRMPGSGFLENCEQALLRTPRYRQA